MSDEKSSQGEQPLHKRSLNEAELLKASFNLMPWMRFFDEPNPVLLQRSKPLLDAFEQRCREVLEQYISWELSPEVQIIIDSLIVDLRQTFFRIADSVGVLDKHIEHIEILPLPERTRAFYEKDPNTVGISLDNMAILLTQAITALVTESPQIQKYEISEYVRNLVLMKNSLAHELAHAAQDLIFKGQWDDAVRANQQLREGDEPAYWKSIGEKFTKFVEERFSESEFNRLLIKHEQFLRDSLKADSQADLFNLPSKAYVSVVEYLLTRNKMQLALEIMEIYYRKRAQEKGISGLEDPLFLIDK